MDKETACNAGDPGDADLIPGLGRPSGGGSRKWQPLQDSYLGNPRTEEPVQLQFRVS